MDEINEFMTLNDIPSSDFVRYNLKDDVLTMFFVKDNQGEKDIAKPRDPELGDEPAVEEEEEDHDDHDNLNGHLYKIVFHGVTGFQCIGEESDLYRHKASKIENNHIHLEYLGTNLSEPEQDIEIDFSFGFYQIVDCGKIHGPDV